jgi:hypothetical protein
MVKMLLMTEAEFEAALNAQQDLYTCLYEEQPSRRNILQEAEAACRAREIPEWTTHFCELGDETSKIYARMRIKK